MLGWLKAVATKQSTLINLVGLPLVLNPKVNISNISFTWERERICFQKITYRFNSANKNVERIC